jgi:hypothetical protein
MQSHRLTGRTALFLVKKWDRYVRTRWSQGKPPCAVADHLVKFEREHLVKPYRAYHEHDPEVGDIYETRAGNRWKVVGKLEHRIFVDRAPPRGSGILPWSEKNLSGLKKVSKDTRVLGGEAANNDPDGYRRRRQWRRKRVRSSRARRSRRFW